VAVEVPSARGQQEHGNKHTCEWCAQSQITVL
jgi:hypothetical protein